MNAKLKIDNKLSKFANWNFDQRNFDRVNWIIQFDDFNVMQLRVAVVEH